MSNQNPPLQACRTCEHGRNLHADMQPHADGIHIIQPICGKKHAPGYNLPTHEHDDQHGFYRHCLDWQCRAEVIDADAIDGEGAAT